MLFRSEQIAVDQLVVAVESGNTVSVDKLLPAGEKINGISSAEHLGKTPLEAAAASGDVNMVKFLIDHGAEVKARSDLGETPLHFVAKDPEVIKVLVAKGADVNARDRDGNTPLHAFQSNFVEYKQAEIIDSLLSAGASVDGRNDEGETPLIKVLKSLVDCSFGTQMTGALPIADVLQRANASFSVQDYWGNSAVSLVQDIQRNCKHPWGSQEESDAADNAVAALTRMVNRGTSQK